MESEQHLHRAGTGAGVVDDAAEFGKNKNFQLDTVSAIEACSQFLSGDEENGTVLRSILIFFLNVNELIPFLFRFNLP
jgi:hypothetical protein